MFGKRIQENREAMGLSRADLAEYMQVSATTIYKWENEQAQPNINALQRLAQLFRLTIDELCDFSPSAEAADNMAVLTRAFRKLTPEEQKKYLAVGRALFEHAFPEERK